MKKRVAPRRVKIGRSGKAVPGLFKTELYTFKGGEDDGHERGLAPVLEYRRRWAREVLQAARLPIEFKEALDQTRKKPGGPEWHAARVLKNEHSLHQCVARGEPHAAAVAMHLLAEHWWYLWIQTGGLERWALAGLEQAKAGRRGWREEKGKTRAKNYAERNGHLRRHAAEIRSTHPKWSESRIATELARDGELSTERIRKIISHK